MNLNTLTNTDLILNFKTHVASERKITAEIIRYIAEIDRRRVYLDRGFTSLFDYLVKNIGYSPGAAMRRIDAARITQELPEVLRKIEAGALTLSQTTQVQKATRHFRKENRKPLPLEDKRRLFKDIENTNQKETERIIANTLDLPVPHLEKEVLHKNNSVTLTLTFTSEQMEILEQVQNMIAHTGASCTWADTLTYLAKKEIGRRTQMRAPQRQITDQRTTKSTAVAKVDSPLRRNRYIPQRLRKTLLHAKAVCSYKDKNGESCQSQRFLQIDHIRSWSQRGPDTADNLQVLCGVHNRLKYERYR